MNYTNIQLIPADGVGEYGYWPKVVVTGEVADGKTLIDFLRAEELPQAFILIIGKERIVIRYREEKEEFIRTFRIGWESAIAEMKSLLDSRRLI